MQHLKENISQMARDQCLLRWKGKLSNYQPQPIRIRGNNLRDFQRNNIEKGEQDNLISRPTF